MKTIKNLLFTILMILPFSVLGQNIYQTNGKGSVFHDTNNWECYDCSKVGERKPNFFLGKDSFIIKNGHHIDLSFNVKIADLTIEKKGTLKAKDVDKTFKLEVRGDITNNGTINLYNSPKSKANLVWRASGKELYYRGNEPILANFFFKSPFKSTGENDVARYHLESNIKVLENIVIEDNAILNGGSQQISVQGNWVALSAKSTFKCEDQGVVIFNNPKGQVLSSNSINNKVEFLNIIFNGGGMVSWGCDVIVKGNLLIDNQTSILTNRNVYSEGDFVVKKGSSFTQRSNTVYFDGGTNQFVELEGKVIMNEVIYKDQNMDLNFDEFNRPSLGR